MRAGVALSLVAAGLLSANARRAAALDGPPDPTSRPAVTDDAALDPPIAAFPPAEAPPSGPLPAPTWFTLQTPHFHIHFYEEERPLALHAAVIAERAFLLITRYLNWKPSGRVNLTLNDQTDFANGFASSVPENFVYGFGAPPGPLDELNDFDDYLKLLITHEFTHVVHLDTILGFARLYNGLFGKLYAPNLAQPNWFVEGLAVLMESRQTSAGRVRSSFFDMELRVPFLEGRELGIDNVSNGPLAYPQGTAAYLYGSSVLKYLEDRYGPDKVRELSHRYGSSVIPGGLNRTASRALGAGYVGVWSPGIWDEWRRSTSHKYQLQADEARRRGLSEARRLTTDAPGPRGDGLTPRFFKDGTVLYHRSNTDQGPAYVRLDPGSGARRVLADAHGWGPASPTPDGRALIFQQLNLQPLRWRISGTSHLEWNDLFRFELATGEVRELTRGRRADEPDVSPDGTQIACTVGTPGARKLAVVPVAGGTPRVLAGDVPGLAYSPAWSPDGRLIAYSRWKPGGLRDVHLYDVQAGTDRALWVDRAMDVDPRFSPDGRFVVFSSDRTGIYNIFAYELASERLYQVTNILSGAFQPAVSPDGGRLVYMGFTSAGFDLFTMAFDPWSWLPAQPSANARPDAAVDPGSVAESPEGLPGEAPVRDVVERIDTYQPWKYMYPRSWVLGYLSDPLGIGNSGRVQFRVADPVGSHSIGVDTLIPANGDVSVRADYSYLRLWPSFSASLARNAGLACDLVIDGANVCYRQHAVSGSVFTGLPVLRRPSSSADVSFGYAYSAYAPAEPLPAADPTGGITRKPEIGPDANLYLSWSFSNVHSWAYSISGQEGRRLQLFLQISDPALGGRFHTTELTWTWTEFLTPPWARLHALAVLYSGGVGIGDKRAVFGLGGFVEQDLVRSLFRNRRQCCTFLRGYQPNAVVGDQYHLLSVEYRLPFLWLERSYATFPVYLRRIYGAAFVDVGNAFFGGFRAQQLRTGVGGELRFQFNLAYYLESELQLGFAQGLATGGSKQFYFVTSFPF